MVPKILVVTALLAIPAFAQTDPGPRPGQPPNPRPVASLTQAEMALFTEGLNRFREVDSVSGTQPGAQGKGLGPRFNLNSCAGCHAQPVTGGTSPQINPQIAVATQFGATNTIPSFLSQNGPVRVARFIRKSDGTPDGGVHALFVISGRSDAAGCQITQPDFAAARNNLSLRIPTPVFGAGLIEAIPDSAIVANKLANLQLKARFGIGGHENRNGNDGTVTRFGWKAQNKSLELFAGEAYNVEQGVTNVIFPDERDQTPGCGFNATPEDRPDPAANSFYQAMSDITGLTAFMRMLAPPPAGTPPGPLGASINNGRQAFAQAGCNLCHTAVMNTANSSTEALRNQPVQLYSDLLVHRMGRGLADGVSQGDAQGEDWRTAPLWGLGQRLFFLHDGRATDLPQAIQAHSSPQSEANGSVATYTALPANVRQDILNFLRSL